LTIEGKKEMKKATIISPRIQRARDISSELKRKGITYPDIGRMIDRSPNTIGVVVNGFRKSKRIQKFIALLLDKSFSDIWDNSYPDHMPIINAKKRVVND
jgi:lambda repressor-like predicted transcriptional regulator